MRSKLHPEAREMTHEEIALRLGISKARVMQLEHRALQKMAKLAIRLGVRLPDGVTSPVCLATRKTPTS